MATVDAAAWRARAWHCLRRDGLSALPRIAAVRLWRGWLRNRNWVFVCEPPPIPVVPRVPVRARRYTAADQVPVRFVNQLVSAQGPAWRENCRREFAGRGILWLALCGDDVAAFQWSRRGRDFLRWFTELAPQDIVIFGGTTRAAFRGRGIIPYLVARQIAVDVAAGGRAWCDCKVWNQPARRCIEKVGFRCIGARRPLRGPVVRP